MNTFKISSLLMTSEDDVHSLKNEFERHANGMPLEAFRHVVASRMTQTYDERPDSFEWVNWTRPLSDDILARSHRGLRRIIQSISSYASRRRLRDVVEDPYRRMSMAQHEDAMGGRSNDWVTSSDFEAFFKKIDSNSDGLISWEDVLQLAVEEATQSITLMVEEMRSYSFSRKSSPMKLIQTLHTLPYHKSVFAVVSRADPLMLFSRKDFSVVKSFSLKDLDNAHPRFVEYLPVPDVLLSYSAVDKKIRGWWSVTSSNRMGTLKPLHFDDTVRRIRTHPSTLPYSFFTGGSRGDVVHWQVPKQRSVVDMSQTHCYGRLHSRNTGGITDFVVADEWLLSTGFDHRLLSTNLESGRSILIGHPSETIRFLEYNRSYSCIPAISYSNQLLLWDVRCSALTPGTVFTDDSSKQHVADVIGLCNALGLPQVITADSAGWVKVWDLRMLRCIQTFLADGSVAINLDIDFSNGKQANIQPAGGNVLQNLSKNSVQRIRSLGYFQDTQEIICSSSELIYCLRYNHRREGACTDPDAIHHISYDLRQATFVFQGATRASVWDAAEGYRKRVFDRATDTSIPYWQHEVWAFCLDSQRSRAFFAVDDGLVEVRSSKDFELLDSFRMHESRACEMLYSSKHSMLVSISMNGCLALRTEAKPGVSTITLSVSSHPLRALTMSDEVGVIGCCDDRSIFLVDFKQSKLYPFVIEVDLPVRAMELLGKYPVLATGDDSGKLVLWSMPPVEAGHVALVSFFIDWKSTFEDTETIARTKNLLVHSSNCHSNTLRSAETGAGLLQQSMTDLGQENYPCVTSEHISPDRQKKEKDLNDLLRVISAEELMDYGISAVSFDEAFHRLFLVNQKGSMFIYSLCPFMVGFGIRQCVFHKRRGYRLLQTPGNHAASHMPLLLRKVTLHNGPVNFIKWIPELNCVVSSGSDLVKISDRDGEEGGVFLMNRIPSRRVLDEMENVCTFRLQKVPEDVNTPYSLPLNTSISRFCEDCAKVRAGDLTSRCGKMDEPMKTPEIPLLPCRQPSHNVSSTNKEIVTQLGSFMGAVSGLVEVDNARNRGLTPPPPPSPVVFRFVSIEEKKKWKPRKEKACAFWGRRHDSPPRPTRNSGGTTDSVQATDNFDRLTLEGELSGVQCLKGCCMLTAPLIAKGNSLTASRSMKTVKNVEASAVSEVEPLVLFGASAESPKPPLLPMASLLPHAGAKSWEMRQTKSMFRSKNNKKTDKCFFSVLTRQGHMNSKAVEEDTKSFSDEMLGLYDKELHRCLRGRGGQEQFYKRNGIANGLTVGALRDDFRK